MNKIKKVLQAIGIETSPERRWHVHLRPRFFALIGIAIGLIFVALLGMAKYSESPSFCNSCHIMGPYYKAWSTSKHNKVACVECHYPPGKAQDHLWKKFQALSQVVKYVTRTYSSRPFAEIEDAACLRSGCHSTRLLQGKLTTSKGIKFDHTTHIMEKRRGRQLRCVSCHSQIVVGTHVEVTYDTCYLCHFKGKGKGRNLEPVGGCLGCHNLPIKTFQIGNMTYNHKDFVTKQGVACQNCHLDVIQGEGNVSQDRCLTCHNQPEKLARFDDVAFVHENHVTKHNVACFHCHQEIRHGFGEKGSGKMERLNEPAPVSSEMPHPPTLAFDCSFCHENKHVGQLEMYSGKVSALGLPEMPSPMYLANVDCIGCHYQGTPASGEGEFRGKNFESSKKACVKCHGAHFEGIWSETKNALKETLTVLGEKLKAVQAGLKTASVSPEETRAMSGKVGLAKRWHDFVRASHGEHNIYLASLVLRREDQLLSEIGEKIKAQLPDLSSNPLLSGSYCATLCHSKVSVKVPPEFVVAFGKKMPHKAHTGMMGCVQCHEIGAHKSVPLKKGVKNVCTACHAL